MQAYAAGLLEGSLCWQLIYWHWQNTVATLCKHKEEFCDKVRKQLEENSNRAREQAIGNDKISPYWHQVRLSIFNNIIMALFSSLITYLK